MKQIFLILLFIWSTHSAYAQKRNIDFSSYSKWPTVGEPTISNDGEYMSYVLRNIPVGGYTLVLKAIQGKWEVKLPGVKDVRFSADNRTAFFTKPGDTLGIVKLGKYNIKKIGDISSFQLPVRAGEILVYQLKKPKKDLYIRNFNTGTQISYLNVNKFLLSEDGETLIMEKDVPEQKNTLQILDWLDIRNNKITRIWQGMGLSQVNLDATGKRLVYMLDDSIKAEPSRSLLYYEKGAKKSQLLVNDKSKEIGSRMRLNGLSGFGKDGISFFFTANSIKKHTKQNEVVKNLLGLNLWSYLDAKLRPGQEQEDVKERSFTYVIDIPSKRILRLEENDDVIMNERNSNIAFILHLIHGAEMMESSWNRAAHVDCYIESVKEGRKIDTKNYGSASEPFSPKGNYVIFYNKSNYYSYEISSGEYRNLTGSISTSWINNYGKDQMSSPRGVAAWLANEEGVFIYDEYDIWLLDPKGKKLPVNVTNRYGSKQNIVFYLGLPEYVNNGIRFKESLILNALSLNSKKNGFFKKDLSKHGDPEKLTFDNHIYDFINNPYSNFSNPVVKARDKRKYIVSRMSATEALNYYYTSDFKKFTPLSCLNPERNYNWYTTELHTWNSFDGKMLQGILYKPENFDASKKYPVILNYYEKKSFNLNAYLVPSYPSGQIDIPTYVSNGYLVFTPDITYTLGNPMEGTYNAVVSAGEYLSKLPFVNSHKMGIQGFSFGGVQTNYLVTHTNLFSAACSASGMSNFISSYLSISKEGYGLQPIFENGGQNRMGSTLWENKNGYIKNSAVLTADKTTTPFLMMHTTNDRVCLFPQALELFTALRRLGKKVWLLEYTNGIHTVHGKSAMDYAIRMSQFFDHYLKDKPAPLWMLDGVAAKDRCIKTGLELDTTGRTPGPGLLTSEEQKKVDSLMAREPVSITFK